VLPTHKHEATIQTNRVLSHPCPLPIIFVFTVRDLAVQLRNPPRAVFIAALHNIHVAIEAAQTDTATTFDVKRPHTGAFLKPARIRILCLHSTFPVYVGTLMALPVRDFAKIALPRTPLEVQQRHIPSDEHAVQLQFSSFLCCAQPLVTQVGA
jgi:hypothetical protein